jgi:hypothetical protein
LVINLELSKYNLWAKSIWNIRRALISPLDLDF